MQTRFLACAAFGVLTGVVALQACSDDTRPAPVRDRSADGGELSTDSGVPVDPCNPPKDGCPCADAGVGNQVACGTVYRTSGTHVDCSKGYRTCQEDGGWGACEGTHVYIAADQ